MKKILSLLLLGASTLLATTSCVEDFAEPTRRTPISYAVLRLKKKNSKTYATRSHKKKITKHRDNNNDGESTNITRLRNKR